MMRQSKIKYKMVLKGESPRSESTQTVTGEEQRTSMNSIVANDITRPKPEGHLASDVHRGKRKVQCYITHATRTWNVIRTWHER